MDTKYKTLLGPSAEVLRHFSEINKPAFTLDEAVELLDGTTKDAVKKLIQNMISRGLLLRLKDGVYWIIPYEQDATTYFPNSHLVARYLVGEANYYIGYYSAMEVHSLITQPSLQEQIVVNKQIKPSTIKIHGHKFRFIYHNKNHFFGSKNQWIDSYNKVQCSDLEKTFVDCLYKPDYAGGISELAKALFKSKDKIDFDKLFDYCKKFKAQSVIKRLGFLLEILDIANPISFKLLGAKTASYILLEPSYEKRGELISKWSIQQNIETNDITSSIFS